MSFAYQVYIEAQKLRPHARTMWRTPEDREDGIQETICKALTNANKFDGNNLGAWLNVIMRNIRRDQIAKGYRKGTKPQGDRLVYAGHYDYAAHLPSLDDPEAILIAQELYA